jgi:hypothetical protein
MSHTSTVFTLRAMDLATYVVETFILTACKVSRDLSAIQNNYSAFMEQFFIHKMLF